MCTRTLNYWQEQSNFKEIIYLRNPYIDLGHVLGMIMLCEVQTFRSWGPFAKHHHTSMNCTIVFDGRLAFTLKAPCCSFTIKL